MKTIFKMLSADGGVREQAMELEEYPTMAVLRTIVQPYLAGATMYHIRILDPANSRDSVDMFVDETALLKGLPLNAEATKLYRAAHLLFHPNDDPDELPIVCGAAAVFTRRVVRGSATPDSLRASSRGANSPRGSDGSAHHD